MARQRERATVWEEWEGGRSRFVNWASNEELIVCDVPRYDVNNDVVQIRGNIYGWCSLSSLSLIVHVCACT